MHLAPFYWKSDFSRDSRDLFEILGLLLLEFCFSSLAVLKFCVAMERDCLGLSSKDSVADKAEIVQDCKDSGDSSLFHADTRAHTTHNYF